MDDFTVEVLTETLLVILISCNTILIQVIATLVGERLKHKMDK